MNLSLGKQSPVKLLLFLLAAVTLFRLWFATCIELVPDEAYYWLWSKHLAASYRDKGPAIAWTIALGTKCFGDTVLGIRFFAVILSGGIGGLLWQLAREMYGNRTAWWCLAVAGAMPMLAVGSILMTIDSLSLFAWALAAWLFWRILQRERLWLWIALGLTMAAGFLAKFTNGLQLACVGLCLLSSAEHRRWLWGRNFWLMNSAFAVGISPVLWWNLETGWVHFMALHSRSGVGHSFEIHPMELMRFIGEESAVVSPLFAAGIAIASLALLLRRPMDLKTRFLLTQSLPVYAVFMFFSLNKSGKANWIAPALITAIIFTVAYWRELVTARPAWRRGVQCAFAMALVMTAFLHCCPLLPLPAKLDPLRRAEGWRDFGAHIQQAREKYHSDVIIGGNYSYASMASFYLADHPRPFLPPEPYGNSQFSLWPGYSVTPHTHALLITDPARPIPEALKSQFDQIVEVDNFWTQHEGRSMNHVSIYACSRNEISGGGPAAHPIDPAPADPSTPSATLLPASQTRH